MNRFFPKRLGHAATLATILAALLICPDASAKATAARLCDPLAGDVTQAQAKELNRSPMTKAATITGYVASAKPGGIETCNCHAKDAPDFSSTNRRRWIYYLRDVR